MENLKIGTEGYLEKIVEYKDTAISYGSGLIEVFATPAMIGLMEMTAQLSVQGLLPEGYTTVGTEVNIKHIKASLVGEKVYAKTVLLEIDGKKLVFEVAAFDTKAQIGLGTHTRFIVHKEGFMEKTKSL
ncbi:MAG: thioesterase family protein [Bacteroidales bacterium]|nr:thioesterase family protein [Bacteroidales bacterium]MDY0215765.1 thioesterase family protein [Bacteroidales bacterium]